MISNNDTCLKNSLIISSIIYIAFAIFRVILGYYDSLLLDIPLTISFIICSIVYYFIKNKIKVIKFYFVLFMIICFIGSIFTFELKGGIKDLFVYASYPFVIIIWLVVLYFEKRSIEK